MSSATIHKNGSSTGGDRDVHRMFQVLASTAAWPAHAQALSSSYILVGSGGAIMRLYIFGPFSQQKQSWHQLRVSFLFLQY